MAKQTSIITFTGRLGNLIGYSRGGKHFLRSMPDKVRQTTATRRAAQRFGMASRRGALIRNAFSGRMEVSCDTGHINRLTGALIPSAGHDTQNITGFRFNRHAGTDRFLALPPKLSRDGILHIPPQALPAYKGIDALEIKVIAARVNFTTHQVIGTESTALIVNTGESFKGAACDVDIPGNGTLVVVLQIRGIQDNRPSGNRKYLAADIIAVQPPQTHEQITPKHPGLAQLLKEILSTAAAQSLPHVTQRE
ncbi:MAG TPA: hypothetical protein VM802_09680 [Chitinophaga sp.]|uniref:hypothetical protein n=1 Tax=Chitinophaga sp. TaxID=1869181 RepID=UPI002C4C15AB|nr:hypothetical protein [Chitinophaga sp.]HVI45132.1 hypothetical protein [Chitinophaga sp.]